MNALPKYTIAIPAYKGQFLTQCIDSVLGQQFTNFELIIVNDASPDPIGTIVAKYKDSRIRYYINKVNRGAEHMVDNWNKCLNLAKGEYFILLGDDDFLDTDFLTSFELLIAEFPGLQVYHCRSKIVDTANNIIDITPPWPSYENVYDNMYYRLSMSRIQYISDFVYLTSGLRRRGGFYKLPLAWGSDDITAFTACAVAGIAHINKPIFNYRESNFTITRSGNILAKMQAVEKQSEWLSTFLQTVPFDPLDKLRHQWLLRSFRRFVLMKKADLICVDIQNRGLKGLYAWFKQASRFGVSRKLILRIFLSKFFK